MLGTMNHTTRNAPFGTDDTPDMQLKIVGGKRVQITVDRSQRNGPSNQDLNQTWPLPRLGPHGTPSILTQPNWEAYDSRMQSRYNTSDQHNLARNVSSYTSPMGDRSHSFKHGAPTLNTKAVLPPIATQSADHLTYRRTFSIGSSEVTAAGTTLEEQVGRQLKNFSAQKLKNMYIDLATFDRELTGMVGEAQFSVVALRHDLPLKLSLLKIIFAKFVDIRDPSMINYEKILQFLSDCMSRADEKVLPVFLMDKEFSRSKGSPPLYSPVKTVTEDHPLQDSFGHSSKLSHFKDVKSPLEKSPGNGQSSPLRKEMEEKLVELILAQLSPEENLEIEDLRKSLRELDRLEHGNLPIHVINSACVRQRLPLTSSIINKLLQRAETNGGMADWNLFLEPLERVQRIKKGSRSISQSELPETPVATPSQRSVNPLSHLKPPSSVAVDTPPPILQWEKTPLGKIRTAGTASVPGFSRDSSFNVTKPNFGSMPASPPSTTSSIEREIAQLPDGWDEREMFPRDNPDEMYVSPRRTEPWSLKFNKLKHALRTYHPLNKEVLARHEAERVAKNYNLIYGLGFSEKKIENAVQQSLLPKKDGSAGKKISVNALLELLEGKRRLIV